MGNYEIIDLVGHHINESFAKEIIRNDEIVEAIDNRIEWLDVAIKREEANLKNVSRGFLEISYRMIEKLVWEKTELCKIVAGEKNE